VNRGGRGWRQWAGALAAFVAILVAVSYVSYTAGENHSRAGRVAVAAQSDPSTTVGSKGGGAPCQAVGGGPCGQVLSTTSTPPTLSAQPPVTVRPTANIDQALASCSVPESGVATTPTESVFLGHLIGTWLLCHTPSAFGTKEAGMRIMADGTWSKLTRNSSGQLAAIPGWDNNGTWNVVDDSSVNGPGTFQLNFKIAGSGEVFTLPVFSSGPPKMRLDNNGMFVADYVPVSAAVQSGS
jgi:hypothetical protein